MYHLSPGKLIEASEWSRKTISRDQILIRERGARSYLSMASQTTTKRRGKSAVYAIETELPIPLTESISIDWLRLKLPKFATSDVRLPAHIVNTLSWYVYVIRNNVMRNSERQENTRVCTHCARNWRRNGPIYSERTGVYERDFN